MRIVLLSFLTLISISIFAQEKKIMDHDVFDIWNKIAQPTISDNGEKVLYQINPGKGDASIHLYDVSTKATTRFDRAKNAAISQDGSYLIYTSFLAQDSLDSLKRIKTKKADLPNDTLVIYNTSAKSWTKIADLKSYHLPSKWSDYLIYHLAPQKPTPPDTTKTKAKKETPKTGSKCIVRHLTSGVEDTLQYTTSFKQSDEGGLFAAISTGMDSTDHGGVYTYDIAIRNWEPVLKGKAEINKLTFNEKGTQLAFTIDQDTTKLVDRPHQLFLWQKGKGAAKKVVADNDPFLPPTWNVSADFTPRFSDDGRYVYYGIKPPAVTQDTSLLEDEIVNVEVWSYTDPKLHTQQKVQLPKDQKKSYTAIYDIKNGTNKQLTDLTIDQVTFPRDNKGKYILAIEEQKYQKYISWQGYAYKDLFLVDRSTGNKKMIAEKITGNPRFSNAGKYIYWYSAPDTSWLSYSIESDKLLALTNNQMSTFYDELNDRPMHPQSYGNYGWTENDQFFLVNDRYDIWKVDPKNPKQSSPLTMGRIDRVRYRYINVDKEQKFVDLKSSLLLHVFDEKDKSSGYAALIPNENKLQKHIKGPYRFSSRPIKAQSAPRMLFTKENFEVFPDLLVSDPLFKNITQVSHANPQQSSYKWGTSKIHKWTSLTGRELEGLLITPEDFDPSKKYPLLVNFYERSSHNLHIHRAPYPHRSTINYSFYTNRGYVIFNPDVFYENGYPGKGAYDCVIPGVESLIALGFIDKNKIGVQGHSWGGYQVADLITKTDIFACAESGAPVVNMISAYGGIRWASGLSRMFQYEHTQSRLGATLWERPDLYIENSPIFNIDKINTPVLIMHNDNDGHVPWYQGIEFFVALRRLGKPAWMLNYNDEPHWPLKRQNRLDFNKRMQQFFDHYLMDGPKPSWMEKGVSAMDKGINQGY